MITRQTIRRSIEELSSITKTRILVFDLQGAVVVDAGGRDGDDPSALFAQAQPVSDDEQERYLVAADGENAELVQQIAAAQLHELLLAYQERIDRNSFFQNLLLDNLLLADITGRAKKLHIEDRVRRIIYLVEVGSVSDTPAMEYLTGMFSPRGGDQVTSVDETSIIVVRTLADDDGEEQIGQVARDIASMLNTEAMINARVAYGMPVDELRNLSKSYKEAMLAMDVGKIFYAGETISSYSSLGIGRLIYQLPASLCRMFITEVFGDPRVLDLDEETRITADSFFENNLNVSETARKLFVHRNTLVYRIDKLQKELGLDIRDFDDALTLKISLMVYSYLKYLDNAGS